MLNEEHKHAGDKRFSCAHAHGQQDAPQPRREVIQAEPECRLLVSPGTREHPIGNRHIRLRLGGDDIWGGSYDCCLGGLVGK